MTTRVTNERLPQVRRQILTAVFAGLASALLIAGCGGSDSSGTSTAPTLPSASASSAASSAAPSAVATTWTAQDTSSVGGLGYLRSVAFSDATHGWAVGEDTDSSNSGEGLRILVTSDGGATWTAQDAGIASKGALCSVTFVDTKHGWAVGGNVSGVDPGDAVILATSDGGATWKAQDASDAGSGSLLLSVSFVDALHGWAVGTKPQSGHEAPIILATSDSGAIWKAQDASSAGTRGQLNSVHFIDAARGWAVGEATDSNGHAAGGVILATSNGGATWEAQEAGSASATGELDSIASAGSSHLWAVGQADSNDTISAVIVATRDGGATWKAQDASDAGTRGGLISVAFADAERGWAVGAGHWDESTNTIRPVILATSDGGETWKEQDASAGGSAGWVNAVCFFDAARGWAVGVNPTGSGTYTPFILVAGE
jgi:photosystem II stability/assembly factor-like uncharacterized protein